MFLQETTNDQGNPTEFPPTAVPALMPLYSGEFAADEADANTADIMPFFVFSDSDDEDDMDEDGFDDMEEDEFEEEDEDEDEEDEDDEDYEEDEEDYEEDEEDDYDYDDDEDFEYDEE